MIVTFDDTEYTVDDALFEKMVHRYKFLIGYVDGQHIECPTNATQYDAIGAVVYVSMKENIFFPKLDHRIAIANAVMKAV